MTYVEDAAPTMLVSRESVFKFDNVAMHPHDRYGLIISDLRKTVEKQKPHSLCVTAPHNCEPRLWVIT